MSDLREKAQTALAVAQPVKSESAISAVDLEGLKSRFFQSTVTLKEFCRLYGAEAPQLYALAGKDGWIQQRRAFREKMSSEARNRFLDRGIDYEAKLDSMTHRAAKKLTRLISEILSSASELNERAKSGDEKGVRVGIDDLPKLRSGIEALQQSYTLARKTAGLSPEPMPGRGELDLERLSHEEREDLKALLQKAARTRH